MRNGYEKSRPRPYSTNYCVWECDGIHISGPTDEPSRADISRRERLAYECWIVQDDSDCFGFRKVNFNQLLHTDGEILFGTPVSYFHMTPTSQGLEKHKHIACSFTAVFVVISGWFPQLKRERFASFTDQLVRNFIKTDHRIIKSVRFGIPIQIQ